MMLPFALAYMLLVSFRDSRQPVFLFRCPFVLFVFRRAIRAYRMVRYLLLVPLRFSLVGLPAFTLSFFSCSVQDALSAG